MRVLVVDDQSSIRSFIKEILRSLKILDVVEATNGVIALQKLRNSPPFDLMICDCNMPEMSGDELIRNIRADAALGALRILVLTSEQTREAVLKIAALKVQGYVVKPCKPDVLIKAIKFSLGQPLPALVPSSGGSA